MVKKNILSVENLEKIYSSEYSNAPTGNALKNGINRWTQNVIKKKGGRPGEADLRGTYMHDMDNLDDIIHRGSKASKVTNQGSGHIQVPSLDPYASKNKYVKQSVHQSQNSFLNPSLNHVKNKNMPDFGSPYIGVSEGWSKELELVGVGYRASAQGQKLELALGFSHSIVMSLAKEIKVETVSEKGANPVIKLSSFDKQLVGQVAAKIRSFRKPEPYKGKGIRFVGEQIRRKAGKQA